ncbi:hypothetical protein JHK85_003908 [Glycine max]|nr:hypothetical protein JHK87_003597 [Glycine soja]KAG5062725.1 hypothetical protein JHK85_003908 [Glycine max]
MESSEYHTLHIFFFPFFAHGHVIPTLDMAKLFAEKGVKATIVTTPLNAPFISKAIGKSKTKHNRIHIQTIELPCAEAVLPDSCENTDSITSQDLFESFCMATCFLQEPFEQLIEKQHPDCIVADMFFPWATDSAAKFGIPRLVFHGYSFISLCATSCMELYKSHNDAESSSFVIPNLPGEIRIEMTMLPPYSKNHSRNVLGRKAWHIGPLSLCNKDNEEKAHRGKEASIDEHECLKWLDTKKPNSVVYLCFGSAVKLSDSQLREIAMGLEASGQQFIWVAGKTKEQKGEKWLPEGFEKRMEGDSIACDAVEKAVKRIMIGEEAIETRNKAKVLSHLARQSIEEGGSSYSDLKALIEELSSLSH